MTIKNSRRGEIPPFIVMDVLQTANRRQTEGKDVLHLELGQPATGASQVLGCADGIFNNH